MQNLNIFDGSTGTMSGSLGRDKNKTEYIPARPKRRVMNLEAVAAGSNRFTLPPARGRRLLPLPLLAPLPVGPPPVLAAAPVAALSMPDTPPCCLSSASLMDPFVARISGSERGEGKWGLEGEHRAPRGSGRRIEEESIICWWSRIVATSIFHVVRKWFRGIDRILIECPNK